MSLKCVKTQNNNNVETFFWVCLMTCRIGVASNDSHVIIHSQCVGTVQRSVLSSVKAFWNFDKNGLWNICESKNCISCSFKDTIFFPVYSSSGYQICRSFRRAVASEDYCFLRCCAVQPCRSLPTFQRFSLPPSSGRYGTTSQRTAVLILAAVRTSNLASLHFFGKQQSLFLVLPNRFV
jgi:hypothetical protein